MQQVLSPGAPLALAAKVRVSGARRVWGTHWSCTSKAVIGAIAKLCGITPKSVKRKFVKNTSGKTTRWWFVIHDSEEALINLEDHLKLQTLWELEPCFMKDISTSQSHVSAELPTTHQSENTNVNSNQSPQTANGPEASEVPRVNSDQILNGDCVTGPSSIPPPPALENED